MASPWGASVDPVDFDEAIAWFRARVPLADGEWKTLEADAYQRAFTVAHVASADVVAHAWDALDAAIANGETLEDFKGRIGDELEEAWGEHVANPAARLETVFRTNVQSAYGAGRFSQLSHPAVLRRRPYWRLNVLKDNRTSDICLHLVGVCLPADHPWWIGHIPPLHFNCRTTLDALTEREAEAHGITRSPPHIAAQDGFGDGPTAPDDWDRTSRSILRARAGAPLAPRGVDPCRPRPALP
jgi:SPP1 gp7 family putative phage head morphogenesis protein